MVIARETSKRSETANRKKVCAFCVGKLSPLYTDVASLKRFTSSRGKIIAKQRSGICSKHQRALTREIKRARHLALLPFTIQV